MPAGSGRGERLDPFALPLRFEVADHAGEGRLRSVELDRERVLLGRASRGIKTALSLPLVAYRGVAVRMEPPARAFCSAADTVRPVMSAAALTTALRIRKVRRSTPAGTSIELRSASDVSPPASFCVPDFMCLPPGRLMCLAG